MFSGFLSRVKECSNNPNQGAGVPQGHSERASGPARMRRDKKRCSHARGHTILDLNYQAIGGTCEGDFLHPFQDLTTNMTQQQTFTT